MTTIKSYCSKCNKHRRLVIEMNIRKIFMREDNKHYAECQLRLECNHYEYIIMEWGKME